MSLKTTIEELTREHANWAKKIQDQSSAFELEKTALTDKVDQLTHKRDTLEKYLGGFAKTFYGMLEGTSFWSSESQRTLKSMASLIFSFSLVQNLSKL